MRKTKIVCTLGPASSSEKVLGKMLKAGMNIARFNFSHGTHEGHKKMIDTFRKVRDELGVSAAVMLDTRGPEVRIKEVENGAVTLVSGQEIIITNRDVIGNAKELPMNFPSFPKHDFAVGQKILIDDGNIELKVISHNDTDVVCKVMDGGVVKTHKSINVPNFHLDMPFLSAADKSDILFGIENDVDFVAASFVRCADDVISLRKFMDYHGGHNIRIIAKIENSEGVRNFDAILAASDGIMVARGDMGVEIDFEKLPGIQKKFIRKCYRAGKMVITATQMLESMMNNPLPTRAEASDVANAIFDRTSAIMLSGECAMGKFPLECVKTMTKIANRVEPEINYWKKFDENKNIELKDLEDNIVYSTCVMAKNTNADAIVCYTNSGDTARKFAGMGAGCPILAITDNRRTFNQLALAWNVQPVYVDPAETIEKTVEKGIEKLKAKEILESGDLVVLAGGNKILLNNTSEGKVVSGIVRI